MAKRRHTRPGSRRRRGAGAPYSLRGSATCAEAPGAQGSSGRRAERPACPRTWPAAQPASLQAGYSPASAAWPGSCRPRSSPTKARTLRAARQQPWPSPGWTTLGLVRPPNPERLGGHEVAAGRAGVDNLLDTPRLAGKRRISTITCTSTPWRPRTFRVVSANSTCEDTRENMPIISRLHFPDSSVGRAPDC